MIIVSSTLIRWLMQISLRRIVFWWIGMVLLFLAREPVTTHEFTLMPLEVLAVGLSVQAYDSRFAGLYHGHRLIFLLRK